MLPVITLRFAILVRRIFQTVGTLAAAECDRECDRDWARWSWFLVLLAVSGVQTVQGQDSRSAETSQREFARALQKLAEQCAESGDEQLATEIGQWVIDRSPGRQYLCLPSPKNSLPSADSTKSPVESERHGFAKMRRERAKTLWEQAERAAVEGQAAHAVQLAYQVLREDPDHARARRTLGLQPSKKVRQPAAIRSRNPHHAFGWPSQSFWRLQTDHFQITTNHSESAALALADVLEELYVVWNQLFVAYHSTPESVRQAFAGRGSIGKSTSRHRVVLFHDQNEYVSQLARIEPQAKMTLGVYRDADRTAYLFATNPSEDGDDRQVPTWRHEITHQLFAESRRARKSVGEQRNFWLVEGIALYLESAQRKNGYYTVGGFDSRRLQYARYRALHEDFYVPLDRLCQMGRLAVQQDPRIRRLYSQSAGLAHFLMDGQQGRHREALVQLLKQVYRGADTDESLSQLTGQSCEQLDGQYIAWLPVSDQDLIHLPSNQQPTKLCLGRRSALVTTHATTESPVPSVTDRGLAALAQQEHIEWLDLAYCNVSDEGIRSLSPDLPLIQLNLEGTDVSDMSLARIGQWSRLEELDLSHTQVSNTGLRELVRLENLRVLWLNGTRVTQEGLEPLKRMKQLETLVVNEPDASQRVSQDVEAPTMIETSIDHGSMPPHKAGQR